MDKTSRHRRPGRAISDEILENPRKRESRKARRIFHVQVHRNWWHDQRSWPISHLMYFAGHLDRPLGHTVVFESFVFHAQESIRHNIPMQCSSHGDGDTSRILCLVSCNPNGAGMSLPLSLVLPIYFFVAKVHAVALCLLAAIRP